MLSWDNFAATDIPTIIPKGCESKYEDIKLIFNPQNTRIYQIKIYKYLRRYCPCSSIQNVNEDTECVCEIPECLYCTLMNRLYKHAVPKQLKIKEGRLNFTMRVVKTEE